MPSGPRMPMIKLEHRPALPQKAGRASRHAFALCALVTLVFWTTLIPVRGAQPSAAKADQSSHWSLQPLKLPKVPVVRENKLVFANPIDAFIAARLATNG